MIEFLNVTKSYRAGQPVIEDVELKIDSGELFVLIGNSGCGKTTLLKTINKLNRVDSGEVLIDGRNVDDIRLEEIPRLIGYVVQEGGLFPHLTVEENIALIMKNCGVDNKTIYEKVTELLSLVNMEPEKYRVQYPSQLSGGQRQRVGIARALAMDPGIILMDEPFSALDPVTRNELQDEVVRLQKAYHKTIVFVTHDMDEAVKIATKICFIHNGSVAQCDAPANILKHPAAGYIKAFIGKNRLWDNPEFIKAEDIMRRNPIFVTRQRTVIQALTLMRQNNVDSLIAEEPNGRFLGVVWLKELSENKNYSSDVAPFISDVYMAVKGDSSLKDILARIKEHEYHNIGIMPVLDDNGFVEGYITKSSLLSVLSRRFEPEGGAQ